MRGIIAGVFVLLVALGAAFPWQQQDITVTARVHLIGKHNGSANKVVVWLTPALRNASAKPVRPTQTETLVQRNKSFEPHVLVVPVSSVVKFPNRDPFFHNVFSLFEGKRFDLGLYEAGSSRDVHFDKAGISYIFCNIHPEMSAVVIALDTPYYGISDAQGQLLIPHVPPGRYMLRVWYESAAPETLNNLTREVSISESNSTLGVLRFKQDDLPQAHTNLYGRDYDPPVPDSPTYQQQ